MVLPEGLKTIGFVSACRSLSIDDPSLNEDYPSFLADPPDLTPMNCMVQFKRCRMNTPRELSIEEWKEIMEVPAVKESWGLNADISPEEFADMAYGVKFAFSPGIAPGYVGDLYILSGDALGEPFTLIRRDSRLVVL